MSIAYILASLLSVVLGCAIGTVLWKIEQKWFS